MFFGDTVYFALLCCKLCMFSAGSDYDYLPAAEDDYQMTQSDDIYNDVAFDYDSRKSVNLINK